MEHRRLEVTVTSASDLENVRTILKMNPYVVATLLNDQGHIGEPRRTPAHWNGGTSPHWGHALAPPFIVDVAAALDGHLTLRLEIKSERTIKNNKHVGWVDVPVGELLQQGGDGEPRAISYAVNTGGVLDISYEFGEAFALHGAAPDQPLLNG